MKKFLTVVAAFAATVAPAFGASGKIVTDTIKSDILGTEASFNVYLPAGYDKTDKSYPVIYLLHGLYGNYSDWQVRGRMQAIADELMTTGEARETVIIMPNAGHKNAHTEWNGYFNMPGWNYEDFFFREFIPTVEKRYRIIADKGHRAVMGLSMGGGGSAVYCQRHPDMFSSCYAMSAWLDNEDNAVKGNTNPGDKLDIVCQSVCDHSALKFMDTASKETLEQLKTVKWFFDCGDDDVLMLLSVQLHLKMKGAGIHSELRVRNGGHTWEYWHTALSTAFPFASRNFQP
ncbi:MAG: alpha/beta fold hydrolase [Bacteroidales bacterium]|nr:alpha/beta fold hydrolase [Bacteroidales bacterium]